MASDRADSNIVWTDIWAKVDGIHIAVRVIDVIQNILSIPSAEDIDVVSNPAIDDIISGAAFCSVVSGLAKYLVIPCETRNSVVTSGSNQIISFRRTCTHL